MANYRKYKKKIAKVINVLHAKKRYWEDKPSSDANANFRCEVITNRIKKLKDDPNSYIVKEIPPDHELKNLYVKAAQIKHKFQHNSHKLESIQNRIKELKKYISKSV